MVHFLRTQNNRSIIECEVYGEDLSSSVNILEYSRMLLSLNESDKLSARLFLKDIDSLSEIRGEWWEVEKMSGKWKSADEFVNERFTLISNKYELNYITD